MDSSQEVPDVGSGKEVLDYGRIDQCRPETRLSRERKSWTGMTLRHKRKSIGLDIELLRVMIRYIC